ncbi:hypothetical protein [Streptomyces sp. NRRL S-87]|uniref:hypothetical protein n=1 Tax=Streptomyces sp. NRRL S-87 TaxID=1463920 RepID=UPI0004BF4A1D|nr:hypothetical protein [Streptomyces sp. NRRL S-87]
MRDLGRGAVAAVTVLASLTGLFLGIRAEQRAGREEGRSDKAQLRADAQDRRDQEAREQAYADLVDFYRMASDVIVVNGSSHPVSMRLTLPASRLKWDLNLQQPCRQVAIPYREMLRSMSVEEPSVHLTEADLAQLRLEFRDPKGMAWIRDSGGPVARLTAWEPPGPQGRVDMVSSERWNVSAQDTRQCGGS